MRLWNVWSIQALVVSAICLWLTPAHATNAPAQTFTLDGELLQAGTSNPLLDTAAKITIDVIDPSKTCLLYEEQQTVNTSASNGYYTIQVGSNTGDAKRTASDPGLTMAQVFQDSSAVTAKNVPGQTCVGSTYTPAAGDARYLRITVTPSSTGVTDVLSPDTVMDSVPTAIVAETVQGLAPSNLLQVNTTAPADLSQANLENIFSTTNYPKLQSLVAGTSSQYMVTNPSSSVSFNGQAITNVGTPSAATDAATKGYADSYIAGLGTNISGLGVGTGNGEILTWDGATGKWIAQAPAGDSTKLPLAGGTMTGAINMGGNDITNTGYITMNPDRYIQVSNLTSAQETTLIATPLGVGNAGAMWYNTNTNTMKVWNGTSVQAPVMNGGQTGAITAGPTDANSLTLQTNNSPRLTIDSSGNVGVGTTSPAGFLDAEGGVAAAGTNGQGIKIAAQSGGTGVTTGGSVNIYAGGGYASGGINLWGATMVNRSGTDSYTPTSTSQPYPLFSLQIANGWSNDGNNAIIDFQVKNSATNFQNAYFGATSTAGTTGPALVLGQQTATGYTERMRMDGNGNVGIGTTTPGSLLDINGAMSYRAMAAPAVSPASQGRIYFDSTANEFMISQNGSTYVPIATTSTSSFSNVSSISNTGGNITLAPAATTGSVLVNSGTASTGSTSGALVVTGGVGVSGDIYSGGSINAGSTMSAATSLTTPQIYGSSSASGTLKLDGTSNATKGDVLVNSAGGNVGIGTTSPGSLLSVEGTLGAGQQQFDVDNNVVVDQWGELGVGTTSPNAYLDVESNHGSGDGTAQFNATSTSGNGVLVETASNSSSYFSFKVMGNAGTRTDFLVDGVGNVGIGTTSPTEQLVVIGSADGTGAGHIVVQNTDSTSNAAGYLEVGSDVLGGNTYFGQTSVEWGGSGLGWTGIPVGSGFVGTQGTALSFVSANTNGTGYINFMTGGGAAANERMRIDKNGNVGIGTTSPVYKLDVVGNSASADVATRVQNTNSTGWATQYFTNDSGNSAQISLAGTTNSSLGGANSLNIVQNFNAPITFFTSGNSNERMRITGSGNVGIGTTSPAGPLDVEGGSAGAGLGGNGIILAAQSAGTGAGNYNGGNILLLPGTRTNSGAQGRVGIGTTSPAATLDIYSNTSEFYYQGISLTVNNADTNKTEYPGLQIWNKSTGTNSGIAIRFKGEATNPSTIDTGSIVVPEYSVSSASAKSDMIFSVSNGPALSEAMRIQSGGNVGIGTATPGSTLDLNGAFSVEGMAAPPVSPSGQGRIYFDSTANQFEVSQNGGAYVELATTGGAGGGQSSTSSLTFNSNSDNSGSDGGFNFQSNGSNLFTIANNGDSVFTSTTASTSPTTGSVVVGGGLGVAGNINSGGTLTAPQIYGSSAASGNIKIDGTSNATAGNVLLASAGGDVGIGTTSPSSNLQVFGNSTGPILRITEPNHTSDTKMLSFNDNSGAADWTVWMGTQAVPNLYIGSTSSSSSYFWRANWSTAGVAANTFQDASFNPNSLTAMEVTLQNAGDTGDFLHITKNGGVSGQILTVANSGNVGIGTAAPSAPLDVESTQTTNSSAIGNQIGLTYNTGTSSNIYGQYISANATSAGTFANIQGIDISTDDHSSASNTIVSGVTTNVQTWNANNKQTLGGKFTATGATGEASGSQIYGIMASAYGADGSVIGVDAEATTNATSAQAVTTLAGIQTLVINNSNDTTTNSYGVDVVSPALSGTVTNYYGVYIGTPTGAINNYALYSQGGTNYFGGNVGIGTTTPGAMLDVGNSGTTLGTMRLEGNTSGYVQIQPAAAAGSWTMTLPTTAGTSGQVLQTDGTGTLSWASVGTGSVTSITAGAGLTGGTITTSGTIAVDTGTTANKIVALDGSARLPAVDGSQLTNINAVSLQGKAVSATAPTNGQALVWNSTNSDWEPGAAGSGSVTSVGLSMPSVFTVTNSPVTTSGTLTASLATQTANTVFAGPSSGGAVAPTFRGLVAADLPTVPVSKGGTGATALTGNGLLTMNAGGTSLVSNTCSNGQVLESNGTTWSCQTMTSSQWITNGSDIYYSAGKVGIGITNPEALLQVQAATGSNSTMIMGIGDGSATPTSVTYGSSVAQSGAGTAWTNPGNVTAQDGTAATIGSLAANATSQAIDVTGFSFAVPSTAVVVGVVAQVRAQDAGIYDNAYDANVQLIVGGSTTGTNKAKAAAWPGMAWGTTSYGSSNDLWGTTLTPAQVNASNFGIEVEAQSGSFFASTPEIDSISITVYYIDTQYKWALGVDNADAGKFKISESGALGTSDRLTIASGGNVGIGTTSPAEKLDLGGGNIKMGYEIITATFATSGSASCSAGKQVLGGGCNCTNGGGMYVRSSVPSGTTGWSCSCDSGSGNTVYAICANIK